MPELKNTFIKSKMNKDLDSRLITNGEYRDAVNVSVSTSEGPDVGAVENIVGNLIVSDLKQNPGFSGIELIGFALDNTNDTFFGFLTNYNDLSNSRYGTFSKGDAVSSTSGRQRSGSKHIICCYNLSQKSFKILVQGNFLNFSKKSRITNANVLEDLLFWTDTRNQPRKIKGKTAISDPGYYYLEDHISVSKFSPYKGIDFIQDLTLGDIDSFVTPVPFPNGVVPQSTLKNETEQWLPAHYAYPFMHEVSTGAGSYTYFLADTHPRTGYTDNASIQKALGNTPANFVRSVRQVRVRNKTKNDNVYAYVWDFLTISTSSPVTGLVFTGGDAVLLSINISDSTPTFNPVNYDWKDGDILEFQLPNPDYNSSFNGDKDLLKEKFPRFSYRFKYDDDEYSLLAPWSQAAFIPYNYGYFTPGDDDKVKKGGIVDFMKNWVTTVGLHTKLPYPPNELFDKLHVKELQLVYSSPDEKNVKVIAELNKDLLNVGSVAEVELISAGSGYPFFPTAATIAIGPTGNSNSYEWITSSEGVGFALGVTLNTDGTISIESNAYDGAYYVPGLNYQVGQALEVPPIMNNGVPTGSGAVIRIKKLKTDFLYNYTSQKPIRDLSESVILRVSDITPVQAKTQEVVGNRVIYGNFLSKTQTPSTIDYGLTISEKLPSQYTVQQATSTQRIQYRNHTLKQNRSYQVGLVLYDRYGRSSNVILNDKNENSSTSKATIFAPYTNGGTDPMRWSGNNLKLELNGKIPNNKNDNYVGIWSEENPLGWYSYRVVVKQVEHEYYNVYAPGSLSGNVIYKDDKTQISYTGENNTSHIALFNNNINKVPRDIQVTGPSDNIYASDTVLYARTKDTISSDVIIDFPERRTGEQVLENHRAPVSTVKPFSDFGEWTNRKGKDVFWENATWDEVSSQWVGEKYIGLFCYPDNTQPVDVSGGGNENPTITSDPVDPFFLEDNENPVIATVATNTRLGYTREHQYNFVPGSTTRPFQTKAFSKNLIVLETKPMKENLNIYYETSSSGLISELNQAVEDNLQTLFHSGISNFVGQFSEADAINSSVSNVFEVYSGTQPLNDPLSIVRILSIKDGNGNVQNPDPFIIKEVTAGSQGVSPTYEVITTKLFVYNSNSSVNNEYTLEMVAEDGQGNQSPLFYNTISLTNSQPLINRVTTVWSMFENQYFTQGGRTTINGCLYTSVLGSGTFDKVITTPSNNPGSGPTVDPYVAFPNSSTNDGQTLISISTYEDTPDSSGFTGTKNDGAITGPKQDEPRSFFCYQRLFDGLFYNGAQLINNAGQIYSLDYYWPFFAIEDFTNGSADTNRNKEGVRFRISTETVQSGIISRSLIPPLQGGNNIKGSFVVKDWHVSNGTWSQATIANGGYTPKIFEGLNLLSSYNDNNPILPGLMYPNGQGQVVPQIIGRFRIPTPAGGYTGPRLSRWRDSSWWDYDASNNYYRGYKFTVGIQAYDANGNSGSLDSPEFKFVIFMLSQ